MTARDSKATIKTLIKKRYAYFDHIEIWVDTETKILDRSTRQKIKKQGANVSIVPLKISPFQGEYRTKLELTQVNPQVLQILQAAFDQHACAYLIARIEFTVDWVTETPEQARTLQRLFEQYFIHRCRRRAAPPFYFENVHQDADSAGTSYFSPKDSRGLVPLIYSSRQKRRSGDQPCAHFEYRLTTTAACKRHNFRVLQDLIECDILAFMRQHVTFIAKPSKEDVGRALASAANPSRRTLERCCNDFFKQRQTTLEQIPIQQLLSWLPELHALAQKKTPAHLTKIADLFFK
ncbi:hypothetical protein HW932_10945 [Allochromatium humboldtianum]|uniref:Uncharacterized protein n=1 Tax=Allochromatium humboldtianum TaxID=504901 RepID=A0A850REL4_9GAMM|nr:hypothetical protein [Allochromatium humboldtianum]NVZ09777.1 hypothetical protein [Allochromatium humboldtianum]